MRALARRRRQAPDSDLNNRAIIQNEFLTLDESGWHMFSVTYVATCIKSFELTAPRSVHGTRLWRRLVPRHRNHDSLAVSG